MVWFGFEEASQQLICNKHHDADGDRPETVDPQALVEDPDPLGPRRLGDAVKKSPVSLRPQRSVHLQTGFDDVHRSP